jgi:hypothetical protein
MRVNTVESIKLGESIYKKFGSWQNARRAATLRGGVYVLPSKDEAVLAPEAKKNVG